MSIRAVQPGDLTAITAITNFYIATSAIHFAYEPVTAAQMHAQWARDHARFPWLVVERAGEVTGYAKAGVWRERAAYQWTAEAGLYIADAARGHGLGRALYAVLLDELARRGFRSVIAGITLPNPASVRLHEAFGFTPIGVFEDVGWKHERWHAVGFWQKLLAR